MEKIKNMPEAELRLHALKLNKLLGMMKQKSDAEKAVLKSKLSELEGKQNEAEQNSGHNDSENEALNEQITCLNQELEKYKNDIEKLDLEKSSLDEQKSVEIRGLNEKLKMMDEERVREKDILNQLADSANKLPKLETELTSTVHKLDQLKTENNAKSSLNIELSQKLEELTSKNSVFASEQLILSTENDNLVEKYQDLVESAKNAENAQNDQDSQGLQEIHKIKSDYENLVAKHEQLVSTHEKLASTYEKTCSEVTGLKSQLSGSNDEISEQMESLRVENLKLGEDFESVKKDYETLEKSNSDLKNTVKNNLEKANSEIKTVESELVDTKSGLKKAESDLETARTKLNTTKSEFENTKTELENVKSESEQFKTASKQAESDLKKAETEISKLKHENSSNWDTLKSELEAQVSQLSNRNAELLDQNVSLNNSMNESLNSSQNTQKPSSDEISKKDETITKFKQIATKLKKESEKFKQIAAKEAAENKKTQNTLKQTVSKVAELSNNSGAFQAQFDEMQDELDVAISSAKSAKTDLDNMTNKLAEVNQEKADLTAKIDDLMSVQNKLIQLEESYKLLENEKEKEKKLREKTVLDSDNLNAKILEAHKQLEDERRRHTDLRQKLDVSENDAKSKQLLDIEMADAERSMAALHQNLQARNLEIEELKSGFQLQTDRAEEFSKQAAEAEKTISLSEEMVQNHKEASDKHKSDLEELRQAEVMWRSEQAKIMGEMETIKMSSDNAMGQMADSHSEKTRLECENIKLQQQVNDIKRHMDSRVFQKDELISQLHEEKKRTNTDFEDYKKRASKMLKEQKLAKKSVEHEDADKQMITELESNLKELKLEKSRENERNKQRDQTVNSLRAENEQAHKTYSELCDTYNSEKSGLKLRIQNAAAELSSLKEQQFNDVASHQMHMKAIKESYRQQSILDKQKLSMEKSSIQGKLDSLETSYKSVKLAHEKASNELKCMSERRERKGSKDLREKSDKKLAENDVSAKTPEKLEDKITREREETSSSRKSHRPRKSPKNTPQDSTNSAAQDTQTQNHTHIDSILEKDDIQSVFSFGSKHTQSLSREQTKVIETLNIQIKHFKELLGESEAENQRQDHQNNILKTELRKMEKNQARDEQLKNMEYLKNVIYQFITDKSGEKKIQLLKVIDTMLKLSPAEKEQLEKFARGEFEESDDDSTNAAAWGGYMPRWSNF